jgi:hypothetical protein
VRCLLRSALTEDAHPSAGRVNDDVPHAQAQR